MTTSCQDEAAFDADVLIVGAGPAGLCLGLTLRRLGLQPLIVEKLTQGQNTSRAAVIHAHALEMLEDLGVVESLLAEGVRLSRFSLRDRDAVVARLGFDALPTRHACLLMIPQDRTERILREALEAAGGRVEWGSTVTSLSECDGGAVARIESARGTRLVRARHVVGADGMRGIVREAAGIGFSGSTYEDSFVLADVEMDWPHGRDEVMLLFSPPGPVIVAPLPGGRFRIVATLEDAPEHPGVADVQAILDARGPSRPACRVRTVHWSSRFRIHHRLAERYRQGPFLLAGDAAHVHSPAGGQGMNTGIVDAIVLGRILADVLSGRRDASQLDQYEALRRPAAQEVLQLAGRLTAMATLKSAPQRLLRNALMRFVGAFPPARRRLEWRLSGISRRRHAGWGAMPARAQGAGAAPDQPEAAGSPGNSNAISMRSSHSPSR